MPALDPTSRSVYADILSEFPALERARDPELVVQALQGVAPWLPTGKPWRAETSKLYVKPGKHVRILFHFFHQATADSGDDVHVWATGKVTHRDTVEKLRRKAAKKKPQTGDKGSVWLWDHGVEFEPFTTDDDLSHVARLTDVVWAQRYFNALVDRLPLPADARIESVQIDPFKYLPSKRIVLRYHLQHADGELRLFAKHYDGDQGRASAEIQNHLSRKLEAQGGPAVVPRVYHYDPDLQVTFQQAWEGEAITKGDAERSRVLWQRLLAATHALHAVTPPRASHNRLDARALLYKLRKDVADIGELLPQLRDVLAEIQTELTRIFEQHTPERSGFLHGSLLPSQILLGKNNVAFLDFDGTAEGDPLYDVCELLTSFLFEDWRLDANPVDIRKTWSEALGDYESVYDTNVARALPRAYTLTFLLNRTHQHLKKLRPFPESGLEGLVAVLRSFLGERD